MLSLSLHPDINLQLLANNLIMIVLIVVSTLLCIAVCALHTHTQLPDFLDGLFNMLSDSNREIRQAADGALAEFLRYVLLPILRNNSCAVSLIA
jgi:hypothetical protein